MTEPSVSVIVPVHNTQQYLRATLGSLVSQTLEDLEILLVNDASSDSSLEICREFARSDNRIRILTNERQMGLSGTRNRGMRTARGKYVGFVDSDDLVDSEMFERMYATAVEANADILISNMRVVYDGGASESISRNSHPKNIGLGRKYLWGHVIPALVGIESDPSTFIGNSVCDKLFRADVVRDRGLAFDEGRLSFEDRLFVVEFIHAAECAVFSDEAFYTYIRRPNSLQTRYNSDKILAVVRNQVRYRELFGDILDFDSPVAVRYRVDAIMEALFSIMVWGSQPHGGMRAVVANALSDNHVVEWYSQIAASRKSSLFHRSVGHCVANGWYGLAYSLFATKFWPARAKLRLRSLVLSVGLLRRSASTRA